MKKHKFTKSVFSPGNKPISLLLVLTMVLLSVFPVIAAGDPGLLLRQQTFTLTPEDGVTVTLSGMLPTGGSAEAKPAEAEGDNVLHAYDITIFDSRHAEFEPGENQPVSVSFQSEAIRQALADGSNNLTVEHIAGNGKTEQVELTFAEGDEASFLADAFSIYVIRDHDEGDIGSKCDEQHDRCLEEERRHEHGLYALAVDDLAGLRTRKEHEDS